MTEPETRAGTVALVGLPNAGKSSLLNRFLGSKLSIVTPMAQTTRERVVGIDTRDGVQMIFLDTPGIVDPAYLLHHAMAHIVEQTIHDADVVVLLLDAARSAPVFAPEVLDTFHSLRGRLIVAINKIDSATETRTEALEAWAVSTLSAATARISAESGEGVEELRGRVAALLPHSPYLYPEDELSSQSVRFFVSELIRETVFERYAEEIPYSTAVRIEEFRENESPIFIRATVLVERDSQKAILIGKQGRAIRELGTDARRKIDEFMGSPVYLDLWIKVLPRWRKSALELRRLGFSIPKEHA